MLSFVMLTLHTIPHFKFKNRFYYLNRKGYSIAIPEIIHVGLRVNGENPLMQTLHPYESPLSWKKIQWLPLEMSA